MKNEDGFTLTEVLIVVAIMGLVSGSVFGLLFESQKSFQSQRNFGEATRQTRVVMEQISRSLRQAGNDPLETLAVSPIQILGTANIRINADITGSVPSVTADAAERTGEPDGLINSIHEQVVIRHDPNTQEVFVDIGYGEEVMADRVASLVFTFFDLDGNVTTVESEIARARTTMVTLTDLRDAHTNSFRSITLQSDTFLRSKAFSLF